MFKPAGNACICRARNTKYAEPFVGLTATPFAYSVGTQYAAVSALRRQVVGDPRSVFDVDAAFVDLLPKNECECETPGCPG
jgi:hypothetical protein